MSVGLAVGPAQRTAGPLDARRLLITPAQFDEGPLRPNDRCPVNDVGRLLGRVLESRTVLVERLDGSAPVRLPSRAAGESEPAWLSRVVSEVLGRLTDADLACALVTHTVHRATGMRVTIERRETDGTALQPATHISNAGGSRVLTAELQALLAALTRCRGEADANDVRTQNAPQRQPAHAVSGHDAGAFVAAASRLVDGVACLRDADGVVVAAAGSRPGTHSAREIVLRDGSGRRGVLEVDTAPDSGADFGLSALAVRDTQLGDLRMHYLDEGAAAQGDYTCESRVLWLTRFVSALRLRDAVLVGHDWGGLLGLRLAAEPDGPATAYVASNHGYPTAAILLVARMRRVVRPEYIPGNDCRHVEIRTGGGELLPFAQSVVRGHFQELVPGASGRPHVRLVGAGHNMPEDAGETLGEVVAEFTTAVLPCRPARHRTTACGK